MCGRHSVFLQLRPWTWTLADIKCPIRRWAVVTREPQLHSRSEATWRCCCAEDGAPGFRSLGTKRQKGHVAWQGLEPSTSGFQRQHSNTLSHLLTLWMSLLLNPSFSFRTLKFHEDPGPCQDLTHSLDPKLDPSLVQIVARHRGPR